MTSWRQRRLRAIRLGPRINTTNNPGRNIAAEHQSEFPTRQADPDMNPNRSSPAIATVLWLGLAALNFTAPLAAGYDQDEDPFAAGVRNTEALTPEQEQAALHVPPGFRVQLFAAEPDIAKPMNMAFDTRGRLWVTSSLEYPFAAPADRPGRDTVRILEDTDGDGRMDKNTVFADGLNIPIGLLPIGNGCIVYSIPNIYWMEDTNNDGVADVRRVLYGPMGFERDTHGMNNAFRRGLDGWIYACHGFNNETRVRGTDGHEIHMVSGNTFRFKLDGSRIEHVTYGQVNPFGSCVDEFGQIYTADCHSKPIYQMIPGGSYPSFGRPDRGLGFVPEMMAHLHGSTAICGLVLATTESFPAEFRGRLYSGNVMTSRINCNLLERRGMTAIANEQPDFLKSDDPWFRPVDLQFGPDGALYVADFYNRIIGHYEVPLLHPGRDRDRGRIWRISTAASAATPSQKKPELGELIEQFAASDISARLRAVNESLDFPPEKTLPLFRKGLQSANEQIRCGCLWGLARQNQLFPAELDRCIADLSAIVRAHACRVLAEKQSLSTHEQQLLRTALKDTDPHVRGFAATAIGRRGDSNLQNLAAILSALNATPETDPILRYTLRVAAQSRLTDTHDSELWKTLATGPNEAQLSALAIATPTPAAAEFLLDSMLKSSDLNSPTTATSSGEHQPNLNNALQHIAKFIPDHRVDDTVRVVSAQTRKNGREAIELLQSLQAGLEQRGVRRHPAIVQWANQLLPGEFAASASAWTSEPLAAGQRTDDPWVLERRVSAGTTQAPLFLCSLPRGEQLTGVLRSPEFVLSDRFGFAIAGHSGFPDQPISGLNKVRLLLTETGETIAETSPPRNDTAQPVEWNTSRFSGRKAVLELIDADSAAAYAWLAVGQFTGTDLSLPETSPAEVAERLRSAVSLCDRLELKSQSAALADTLRLQTLEPALQSSIALLIHRWTSPAANSGGNSPTDANATSAASPAVQLTAAVLLEEASIAPRDRRRLIDVVLSTPTSSSQSSAVTAELKPESSNTAEPSNAPKTFNQPKTASETVQSVLPGLSARSQARVAEALAADPAAASYLLDLTATGRIAPRVLQMQSVATRLNRHKNDALKSRIDAQLAAMPSENESLQQLISQRQELLRTSTPRIERGSELFKKNCAACHQVAGQGAIVGPQLDGIGTRGGDRLVEDILAPNRNVDPAFRTSSLLLKDGKVVVGLLRVETGSELVLVDNAGKEIRVPTADVEERSTTLMSVMPENWGETVSAEDFVDLVGWLRTSPEPAAAP